VAAWACNGGQQLELLPCLLSLDLSGLVKTLHRDGVHAWGAALEDKKRPSIHPSLPDAAPNQPNPHTLCLYMANHGITLKHGY